MDVVTVRTVFGTMDCLLERGRHSFEDLRGRAGLIPVAGVEALVAASADGWALRRAFKDCA